jgi:hypothetical protein
MVKELPKFTGIPMIPKDMPVARIGFLEDDFGEAMFKEYNEKVKKDFKNNSSLKVLKYRYSVVIGSNVPACVLMSEIAQQAGYRIALPSEIEQALQNRWLPLLVRYVDTGIVLRSEDGTNSYIAKSLTAQIRARTGKAPEFPLLIPLAGLDLKVDSNSEYGLSFILKEDAQMFHAPILAQPSANFNPEDVDLQTGLPRKIGTGSRCLYNGKTGVSRLYLHKDLNLDSDDGNLANSNGSGRIVLVNGFVGGAEKPNAIYKARRSEILEREKAALTELDKGYKAALGKLLNKI